MHTILSKKDLGKYVQNAKTNKQLLKDDRNKYWENNKKNFEHNIKRLISQSSFPLNWKIWVVASHVLSDNEIMPYDSGSWSLTLIIVASPKQGNELLLFYNEARIGFLSIPGIIPLFIHELAHTFQADASVEKYFKASVNDKIGSQLETEAEEYVQALPKEFIKEAVLETILYSYDKRGWEGAQNAIDFFYTERSKSYSGGYLPWVTRNEYEIFKNAKAKDNISLLVDTF